MKKHIVCFGDSNTHGYCVASNGRFDENERWTMRLSASLGDDYLVIEEGLCGRTTCFEDPINEGLSGLDYILPCLMSHTPVDLLIIMLGTNDTKERFSASATCIAIALKRLIAKAIAATDCWNHHTPNILIITPKNIEIEYEATEVVHTMGKGCAQKSEALGKEYEAIATLMNCHYFDANTAVTAYNQIDFMHLTADGHAKLADALALLIPTLL